MCAETENFSSKTCYFWGTDAHSCTFIHRSIIARAKQWTTKTKSIAMCSMWMWKDLKQKCHCAHHIHQKWKCSMSITVANDMVRSPHFPLRESKNSSMKIARIIMLIIVRWGRKSRNKKKLAPKWHKRSKASQCCSRPWTQWTNETKKLFFPLFRFLLPRASHACSHGSMEKQTREIARKSEERGSLVPAFQFARFVFFLSLFYTRRRHTHTLKNHSRNVNSTVVFGARPAYTLKYSTCL